MMSLVNDHDIGKFSDAPEPFGELTSPTQIRMAEDREVAEVSATDATDMRQPLAQVRLPYSLPGCLGREKNYPLSLMQDQPFDQHEAHERFSKAHAITKTCTPMLASNLHEGAIGFFLVAVNSRKHLRATLIPLARCQLVAAEEFLKCFRIDLKRRVETNVP